MLHPILHRKLSEIVEARRAVRWRWAKAAVFGLAAVVLAIVVLLGGHAVRFDRVCLGLAAFLLVGLGIAKWWAGRVYFDLQQLARDIESEHPELNALVRTAVEIELGATGFSYLQEQVLDEAAKMAARTRWADELTDSSHKRAGVALACGLFALTGSMVWLINERVPSRSKKADAATAAVEAKKDEKKKQEFELSVTPGDAEVEKGTRLIVEAKFAKDVPADATIVVTDAKGGESRRIPMRLTVDQQVFGGMIGKVDRDSLYHVEFGAGKSDDYKITTFVYPELVRADAKITPPAYTGQPAKEIKNTMKVTALEGSEVAFQFKVNKPVMDAELFGEDKTIIPLKARADDPTMLDAAWKPEKSQKYRLHLVDDKERANKQPPWITVNVQANQLAKIEVQFPKRDVQVSSIQELPVEAKVSDDLGVEKTGAVFSIAGKAKEVMLSTKRLDGVKKHDVKAQLDLETESVEPRQLVSYYFWAEDKGPKGEVRRAMSDMFFADVRHFEDIFREKEAPPGEAGEPKKGQADKLVELQKQVVNATWRLVRDTNAGKEMEKVAPDVEVVKQSEQMALEQVKEAMEKAEDAEIKTSLTEAWKAMRDAIDPLTQAAEEKKRGPLNQALVFEQSALEWLYRTASREHQVVRANPKSKGAAGEQQNQAQLMNLELKQKEQRYEEEKQASEEQSAEQKENLQVLNRLKELARRQEALAQKMKELEKQIEKAKTEEEKQELANQLKRLQEEQEQLLRDVDDLKEKMEKSENQATMAESKEQLEKTREQVLDAAEKLKQEQTAQAANSATRAQRELEQMQEDFRKKTSRKFSDEMKQMKQQAREAADEQKKIAEALENQKSPDKAGDLSNSLEKMLNGSETARQIEAQKDRVSKLLEEMRRVSEQAETGEPLLSQSLYDAVRKAHTGGVEENLEESRQYARMGDRPNAQEAERKATKAVEDLQKGVDKAAESILGSESDALRMARSELDSLIKGMKQEDAEKAQANAGGEKKPGEKADGANGEHKAGGDAKDGKMADAQKGKASPDGKADGAEQGQKPGAQAGKGQQGKDAKTAQGKDGEKGDQPGEGGKAGQDGKPGQQMAQGKDAQGKGEGNKPGEEGKEGQSGKGGQPGQQTAQAQDGKGQQPGQSGEGEGKSGEQGKQMAQGGKEGQPGQEGQGSQGQGQKGEGQQMAQAGTQGGEGQGGKPGEGQQGKPGDQAGKGEQPGQQGKGGQQASAQGQGQAGDSEGEPQDGQQQGGLGQMAEAGQTGRTSPTGQNRYGQRGAREASGSRGGNTAAGGGGDDGDDFFFNGADQAEDTSPLTGNSFEKWTDRLRGVEELLNAPELRNEAARVLDNARALRVDYHRSNAAPKASAVTDRITAPLIELRDRVAEELAKREGGNNLAPVDRDPVPQQYRDLVRKYYQELGAGK